MIKTQIENNARKIRSFLDESQISSVFEIEKQLSMQRQDILMALGWLAREDKIYFIGHENNYKIMIVDDRYDE
ncbi:winged helix-turn-helix domain-containing protein [Maribellus sp. YY47]|uniref:winged helix-turn-helix domain-containing protein n=1 Tax=Maribellus sp. YY47 TaxID=2929486 RepID=UPI0020008FB2|nr:winged helix-turn-helix domain-containing protein [Maribellus sp. YY47]MCK3683080.1 winged helix-turn-helix domain-containing protein [Maribellus sp. YY47]